MSDRQWVPSPVFAVAGPGFWCLLLVLSGVTRGLRASQPAVTAGTRSVAEEEEADFVVTDPLSGAPCLLASLDIALSLTYIDRHQTVRQVSDSVSRRAAQDDLSYLGSCQDHLSQLTLRWNNNTFTLSLTFVLKQMDTPQRLREAPQELEMDVLPPGTHSTVCWSLHGLTFTYDTTNEILFPEALQRSAESIMVENLDLFRTPVGLSYVCRSPEAVGVQVRNVDLVFNFVHLLPFGVISASFINEKVECSQDLSWVAEENPVPLELIIAGVIAVIVLVAAIWLACHFCTCIYCERSYTPLAG